MKIALNTTNTINIDIQLDKTVLMHTSNNQDVIHLTRQISEKIQEHLELFLRTKKEEEIIRAQEEKNAKKRHRFSNFSEDISNKKMNSPLKIVSLETIRERLFQDGILVYSGLPEVYRFRNSSYAYTIKSNEWSSPFGSNGTEPTDLLKDIAKNIYAMKDSDIIDFVLRYTR